MKEIKQMKDLVVGVIGLNFGAYHLKSVIADGATVGAICDKNEKVLKKVGDECNIPEDKRVTDWHDILNNKDINAVIVVTPDMVHREMVVALLDAGKNVLCEKPLALEKCDIDAIVQAVERNPQCKFMVGQICRFTPAFVKAKELVDTGRIGELYFVESEYAHDYQHMFEGGEYNWRIDPKRHGVIGGGCHAVDLLRWIVNEDPCEVYAYGTHKLLLMLPYDDATISIMKFPKSNVMGKVFVSTGCKRNYTMRTCLYGTKGTLIFDNTSPGMQFFEADEQGHGANDCKTIEIDIANHNTDYEFKKFADAIINNKVVEMNVFEGAKTVAACMAIVESSVTGKIVNPNYDFG